MSSGLASAGCSQVDTNCDAYHPDAALHIDVHGDLQAGQASTGGACSSPPSCVQPLDAGKLVGKKYEELFDAWIGDIAFSDEANARAFAQSG